VRYREHKVENNNTACHSVNVLIIKMENKSVNFILTFSNGRSAYYKLGYKLISLLFDTIFDNIFLGIYLISRTTLWQIVAPVVSVALLLNELVMVE